jgi:hypothetical protein
MLYTDARIPHLLPKTNMAKPPTRGNTPQRRAHTTSHMGRCPIVHEFNTSPPAFSAMIPFETPRRLVYEMYIHVNVSCVTLCDIQVVPMLSREHMTLQPHCFARQNNQSRNVESKLCQSMGRIFMLGQLTNVWRDNDTMTLPHTSSVLNGQHLQLGTPCVSPSQFPSLYAFRVCR